MAKVTIEIDGCRSLVEHETEFDDSDAVAQAIYFAFVGAGFHPNNVAAALHKAADECGGSAEPNPVT